VSVGVYQHTEALNMQIKRLLDDREMVVGDRLFDAQGRYYTFLEHFKLEMLGRELGLISGSLVGRKPAER